MLNQAAKKLSKMHARRNPNLSIQSTAHYSQLEPPPRSSTSGAFLSPTTPSRRSLLGRSPPPSPSLPSLVPRHGRKTPQQSHLKLVKRILIACCGVAFILWLILRNIYSSSQRSSAYGEDGEEWEMVGGNSLPKEAVVMAVQDDGGQMKWTVSIPSNLEFPLRPAQYNDLCKQAMEVSADVRQTAQGGKREKRMLNYYQEDQYFVDIQEAEQQKLLPKAKDTGRPKGFVEDEMIADGFTPVGLRVCDKTLTYVMETEGAGFGDTLMRLWMSYGLAQKEGRAFFIDDSRWPYGRYLSYFMPPPSAGCLPPPSSHIVPCPHTARHIVVSAATVKSTFGHAFVDEFEDARKMRVERQHNIFALARTGYEALFKLRDDDAKYVLNRSLKLYGIVKEHGGITIGMHIRHGDKHPMEYQFHKDYIPLSRYVDTARDIYIDLVEGGVSGGTPDSNSNDKKFKHRSPGKDLSTRHTSSRMILASDDPSVYDSPEIGLNSLRAQDRIVLATKQALEAAQGHKNPWIDEITGWEGGFYKSVFFSLGQANKNANDAPKTSEAVPEDAMKLRELVGRAYLLDIAVLGKADTIVCTVSSITCRLLAVMLGWDEAIAKGKWRNIDGQFDWRGIIW